MSTFFFIFVGLLFPIIICVQICQTGYNSMTYVKPPTLTIKEAAKLACEAVYGNCDFREGHVGNLGCGGFNYYYGVGNFNCICTTPSGMYEWIYNSSVWTTDVGGEWCTTGTTIALNEPFTRVSGSQNGCNESQVGDCWSYVNNYYHDCETLNDPTSDPAEAPTFIPSITPSNNPTNRPTERPVFISPTKTPTFAPFISPTNTPIKEPTKDPLTNPTLYPSIPPSNFPSMSSNNIIYPTINTDTPTTYTITLPTTEQSLDDNRKDTTDTGRVVIYAGMGLILLGLIIVIIMLYKQKQKPSIEQKTSVNTVQSDMIKTPKEVIVTSTSALPGFHTTNNIGDHILSDYGMEGIDDGTDCTDDRTEGTDRNSDDTMSDHIMAHEWQMNQLDIQQMTSGNMDVHNIETFGNNIETNHNIQIRNDKLIATEYSKNQKDVHNITSGNINELQTPGN